MKKRKNKKLSKLLAEAFSIAADISGIVGFVWVGVVFLFMICNLITRGF